MIYTLFLSALLVLPQATNPRTLQWDPSVPEDKWAGVRIYEMSGTPATYTLVATIECGEVGVCPVNTVTFTETSVFHVYVARAYDTNGVESGDSNSVATNVPAGWPQPPTNLRVTGIG